MTTTLPPATRKRAPCNAEWDRIRPEFERLYIQQGRRLREISAILGQNYGFYAEPYMYKVRIAKWGLRKNFRLEDLEAAASTVSHFVKAGLNAPQPIINNRKVPISRAKRHFGALFKCDNTLHPRRMAISPGEQSPHGCSRLYGMHEKPTRHAVRRLPQTVPRVLLQQSANSHLVESTLTAVNNYFAWRLTKSEDHFVVQEAGSHTLSLNTLDPGNVFADIFFAHGSGAYHVLKASIRYTLAQVDLLLLQQHPSLISSLILNHIVYHEQGNYRLRSVIYSYLNVQASKLLGKSHPVSMTLKMLSDDKERMRSSLLLTLMRDVATRQEECNAMTVFDIEYSMVKVNFKKDGFLVASELCRTVLQRYMDKYDETHFFPRQLLRLLGEMNYQQGTADVAKAPLLRVIELDTSQHADWDSIYAMQTLGWIYTEDGEFATAKEWLSRAFEASCNYPEAVTLIQSFKWELDRLQRRLGEEEDMSKPSEEDLSEDEAEVIEELQIQLAQMNLPETTEFETEPARAEVGIHWGDDLRSLSTNNGTTIRQGGQQGTTLMENAEGATMDSLQDLTQHHSMSHVGMIKRTVADDSPLGCDHIGPGQKLRRFQSTQSAFSVQSHGDIASGNAHRASTGTQTLPMDTFSAKTIEQDMAEAEQQLVLDKTNDALQYRQYGCTNSFDDTFDLHLLGVDVQDGEVANEHGMDGSVASLPLADNFPTLVMPQYFAGFESYMDSVSIMGNDGLGTSGNTWTLDGHFDLELLDFDMFGDAETIDPKLIFSKHDAVGRAPQDMTT